MGKRVAGRRLLPLLLVLTAACAGAPPEPAADDEDRPPVEARATVDRAVATTGDILTYTILVEHEPDLLVEIPEAGSEIAGFRIVEIGREVPRTASDGQRQVVELWYQLRADLVGSYVLPSITIPYRPTESNEDGASSQSAQRGEAGSVSTSEIFVEVESVLPADGEADDIRGLKPLRPQPRQTPWGWITAIAGGALAIALLVGIWLWRRYQLTPEEPAAPPHEIAFAALDALRATDFEDPEAVRRFYFEVSEVVRTYVEGRFGLNATDLTTEEILPRLADVRELTGQRGVRLAEFLETTDRVKFAAHEPQQEEIREVYESALGFVESTVPVEPEATAAGQATAAQAPDPPPSDPPPSEPPPEDPAPPGSEPPKPEPPNPEPPTKPSEEAAA
ncbi:MAG: hypothetical protein AAF604_21050 [Acidobacteriota bacterium]